MARKPKNLPLNKSEAIRKFKSENPTVGPKAIAAGLNSQGYEMTAQFVSTVLSNDRRKQGIASRSKSVEDLSIRDLQVAKKLVEKLGGVENAQTALDAYTQLVSR